MRRVLVSLVVAVAVAGIAPAAKARPAPPGNTNATYYNDAALPAADPYVLYDPPSHSYYAYSTDGADADHYFAVYRSADLVTWRRAAGGALPKDDPRQWGNDWFWAPEVYRNPRTGLYFLFYAARSDANAKRWFGYADFEEPCKIGVAVSRNPAGPFHNIAAHPIRYFPYDPDYHDVNLLMGPDQKQPPATHEAGLQAPLGTYIPAIDPNVLFDADGSQYLYYSRNAYRNWVWDDDLGKYIEESNILAVRLTTGWWQDPRGRTMPTIARSFVNANDAPGGPDGPRRDGYVQILDYSHDKQAWENADVNDYALSGGEKKDRRWEEGSTAFRATMRDASGRPRPVYYMTYSANNWETPAYGVGYAVAPTPVGPWRKSSANPILGQDASIGMYSTGHGSIALSPDRSELYYVHHGRPTPDTPQRRLYTERMRFDPAHPDPLGNAGLRIDQATSDRPVPSGVAPYSIGADRRHLRLGSGDSARLRWRVRSALGAPLALGNPLNRVRIAIGDPGVVHVRRRGPSGARLVAGHPGRTAVTLTYQRRRASGEYFDIVNAGRRPVSTTVTVRVWRR